jgi:hypothetical protein
MFPSDPYVHSAGELQKDQDNPGTHHLVSNDKTLGKRSAIEIIIRMPLLLTEVEITKVTERGRNDERRGLTHWVALVRDENGGIVNLYFRIYNHSP